MPGRYDLSLYYRSSVHQAVKNTKVIPGLLTVILFSALLTSCADINVFQYDTVVRSPKPFDFPIAILDKAKINRPYKIIGLVQVDASKRQFAAEIIEQLKYEARKLGGDALIDLQQQPLETHFPIGGTFPIVSQGDLSYSGHFRNLWTAKVIVWQNP